MSAKVEKIELLLKGPKFNKKLSLQLCCGVAKPEAIDDYKKLWSTLEDICVELDKFTTKQQKEQHLGHFKPLDPEDVQKAVIAVDGRDREVMFVGIIISEGVAVLKRVSAFDELRMMARRSTLFLQNFKKMKESDYAEAADKSRKWAIANFEDFQKLRSGELETEDTIVDYQHYLHIDADFENPIAEIKLPENLEVKEPSVDGDESPKKKNNNKMGEEGTLGIGGLLGYAGVEVDLNGSGTYNMLNGSGTGLEVVEIQCGEDEDFLKAAQKQGIEFEVTDGLVEEKFDDQAYCFMEKLNRSISMAMDELSDDEDGQGETKEQVEEQPVGLILGEDAQPPQQEVSQQDEMPGNILDALMDTNTMYNTLLAENSDAIFADFNQHETDISGQLQFMNESTALLDAQELESPLKRIDEIVEENEVAEEAPAEEVPAE